MIGPNEWKDYFYLAHIEDFNDLLYHWRYSTVHIELDLISQGFYLLNPV